MPLTLVTGANGFLGSMVTRLLLAEGFAVRGTDRSREPITDVPDFRPADLTESSALASLVRGTRQVIHVAGLAHQFRRGTDSRDAFFAVNADAVESMARAAAIASVEHFVLVSSVSVYGTDHAIHPNENTPGRPADAYAESKYEGERRLLAVAARTNMRTTILRMATIFGEGDPGNVARLMRSIDRGRFVWIGDGSNWKSLIHRDDAARACLLAASRQVGEQSETYNVAPPPVKMREVVQGLARALGRRPPQLPMPSWVVRSLLATGAKLGPTRRWAERMHGTVEKWLREDVFDGSKFCRDLGFEPTVSLDVGLRREAAWYQKTLMSERRRKVA